MAGHATSFLITAILVAAAAVIALLWWWRERRIRQQHEAQRVLHTLSEDIIAAPTPAGIAEKLAAILPTITQATSVNLYLYQRRTKSLERVPTTADPEPMAAPLDEPPEGLANAAVVCFRNRTLLNIPDVRRNPLVKVGPKISLPKSAFFVPLLSQQETLGVLEVGNSRRTGFFASEEQTGIQHLANQAAASLKLQERSAMREQLFHSEKLAATGQLISGVATELSAPLESIVQLAATLAAHQGTAPSQRDLLRLVGESQRASEIVSRLVSFTRDEEPAPGILDVNALASELMRFREPEWRVLGLKAQNRLLPEPAPVLGSRGQIEQVFLNLLVYAEQHAHQDSVDAEQPAWPESRY
jgi:signal transduction histidine kinase